MSEELKPCAHCGTSPKQFEEFYYCPNKDCPYHGWTVIKSDWQSRPLEDALQAKLDIAVYAMKHARNNIYIEVVHDVLDNALAEIERLSEASQNSEK